MRKVRLKVGRRSGIGQKSTMPALATACLLGLLGGCATMPVAGPVRDGERGGAAEAPVLQALAAPPLPGASPEEVVQGFLQAVLAGGSDRYAVARTYLTAQAAAEWNPSDEVSLYKRGEAPTLTAIEDQDAFTLTYTQVSVVDQDGHYAATEPTERTEIFTLTPAAGGWRIAEAPTGVVVPQDVFYNDYVPALVYFPAAEGQVMVPDVRFFLRLWAATATTQAFLAGPPEYLAGAVSQPAPPGAKLANDVVRVQGGTATVNLGVEVRRASETERALLTACLLASLMSLPDVTGVEFEIQGAALSASPAELAKAPAAQEGVYYLGNGGLWRHTGRSELLAGYESAVNWSSLTVDHSGFRAAGLEEDQLWYIAGTGQEAVIWETPRKPSAAPVFDASGRLWLGAGAAVLSFGRDGGAATVEAAWLKGRRVVGIAPARDGARLAVLTVPTAGGPARLDVTGIERADGLPSRLNGPLTVASFEDLPEGLAWYDQLTVAVLAPTETGPAAVHLAGVGASTQALSASLDPATSLAAGRGSEALYLTGEAGGLFEYNPRTLVWNSVATGARAVTYRA